MSLSHLYAFLLGMMVEAIAIAIFAWLSSLALRPPKPPFKAQEDLIEDVPPPAISARSAALRTEDKHSSNKY